MGGRGLVADINDASELPDTPSATGNHAAGRDVPLTIRERRNEW